MFNKTNSIAFTLIMTSSLFIVSGAQATIYKCINVQAEVYYNDKPCSVTTIERKIKSAKDPVGGYIPPDFVAEKVKESKTGVVVGQVTGRTIDKNHKDDSKSSSKGANTGSSDSAGQSQSQSSDSKSNSSTSSNDSLGSDSGNNAAGDSKAGSNKLEHLSNVTDIEPAS